MTSRRLEAIEGADQAHAPLLNEVTLAIASVELTLRTEVGETQVLENSIVAFKNGGAEVLCELRDGDDGWIDVFGMLMRIR